MWINTMDYGDFIYCLLYIIIILSGNLLFSGTPSNLYKGYIKLYGA